MSKIILLGLFLLTIMFVSACSTKYVCPDGSQKSDPSQCPKQVECYYAYDCDTKLKFRCLSNHCVSISDYNEAMGITEDTRVVECSGSKACKEGYICSSNFCVKDKTSIVNY
mgnify:CR=1 FL=1